MREGRFAHAYGEGGGSAGFREDTEFEERFSIMGGREREGCTKL